MSKIIIWNREFDLEVIYDCYEGEEVLDEQRNAFAKFVPDVKLIDSSKPFVEKYCLSRDKDKIGADTIDNVFKYVMPESIFIKRDCRVAIMCRYKFDPEHGLAVVFNDTDNINDIEVGLQDIIL